MNPRTPYFEIRPQVLDSGAIQYRLFLVLSLTSERLLETSFHKIDLFNLIDHIKKATARLATGEEGAIGTPGEQINPT